jgi:hypothetical protein
MAVETGSLIGNYNYDNLPADCIQNRVVFCTTAGSYTSNTTLAAVAGLAAVGNLNSQGLPTGNLTGGATYRIRGHINGTSGASGGIKLSWAGSSCTATSMNITAWNYNGTTLNAVTTATTLGSQMASTAIYTDIIIDGVIVVNAAGTFLLQAAQNASNGTATTITTSSYLDIERVA